MVVALRGNMIKDKINVIFTGLFRDGEGNMSVVDKLSTIKNAGIKNIYWYTWFQQPSPESFAHEKKLLENNNVIVRQIDEPFPHKGSSIPGRDRQIFNIKKALQDFKEEDIIIKLRWDLDFSNALFYNLQNPQYLPSVDSGMIKNKVWTAFYSIQELFSPSDQAFAGYKRDLDKIINFNFDINGVSSHNYISHDGMMLMPKFISKNKDVLELIKEDVPKPASLMFEESHYDDPRYLNAWAYSYYIFNKYFKTGPLGTSYLLKSDRYKIPNSIVDYDRFKHNYDTVIGKAPKLGMFPKYRAYDDVFINRLISGFYDDLFANKIYDILSKTCYNI